MADYRHMNFATQTSTYLSPLKFASNTPFTRSSKHQADIQQTSSKHLANID